MNTRKTFLRTVATIFFLSMFYSSAWSQDTADLYDFSLEELLELRISIASSKPELIREAPAIVSSINISEMRSMGIHNIEDMLSMLPGFVLQDNFPGTGPQMIRGVTEAFNQKVLFLLDGVPYWQPTHSANALRGISMATIDRIEVIRGPGAVIYGTNANGGVINIITKGGGMADDVHDELTVQLASHEHRKLSVYKHFDSEFLRINVGAEGMVESDYNEKALFATGDPNAPLTQQDLHRKQTSKNIWLKLVSENFKAFFHAYQATATGSGENIAVNPTEMTQNGKLVSLAYDKTWSQTHINLFADINEHYQSFDLSESSVPFATLEFDNNGEDNLRTRVGVKADFDINTDFSINGGVIYEYRKTGAYLAFDRNGDPLFTQFTEVDLSETSAYLQGDYRIDRTRLVTGFRAVDNEKAGSEIMPRLSVVHQLNPYDSIKLLYSVGFNSPNFVQQYVNLPGLIVGDENLSAETVSMWDLAYTHSSGLSQIIVNLFHYKADDFIQRQATNPGAKFVNSLNYSRTGVELDYQLRVVRWSVLANASYHYQGNTQDEQDNTLLFVPKLTSNLGVTYRFMSAHSVGTSLQYVGKRAAADDFVLSRLNYRYQAKQFEVDVVLQNVFSAAINSPDTATFNEQIYAPAREGAPTLMVEFRGAF
mgnify:CR=1 FL=1